MSKTKGYKPGQNPPMTMTMTMTMTTTTTTLRTSAAALERALGGFHLDAMASTASSESADLADAEAAAVQYFDAPEDARLLRCDLTERLLEADNAREGDAQNDGGDSGRRSAEGGAARVNGGNDGDCGGARGGGGWAGDDTGFSTPMLGIGIGLASRPPPQSKRGGDVDGASGEEYPAVAMSSAAARVGVSVTLCRYEDGDDDGEGRPAAGGDWRRKGGASIAETETDGFHSGDDEEGGGRFVPPPNGVNEWRSGFDSRVSVRLVDATPAEGLHSDPAPADVHSLLRNVLRCQGGGAGWECDARGHCSSPWSLYYRLGDSGNKRWGKQQPQQRRRHRPCPCSGASAGDNTDPNRSPRQQSCIVGIVVRGELSGGGEGDGDAPTPAVDDSSSSAAPPDLVEEMMKFRVSDVAPSFHLYSAAPLLLSSSPSQPQPQPQPQPRRVDGDEDEDDGATGGDDDAVASAIRAFFVGGGPRTGLPPSPTCWLFVYRHLPPRRHLQPRLGDFRRKFDLSRPGDDLVDGAGADDDGESQEPGGCLWEAYLPSPAPPSSRNEDDPDDPEEDGEPTLLVRYRRVSPPYVDWVETYGPLLRHLLTPDNFAAMREEVLSIPRWTPWPEDHYDADGGSDWTVFPLCHTFPATEPRNRKWIMSTCGYCPRTVELLQENGMLGGTLRTALFSRLGPRTLLAPHTGWEDLANHVLRVHLPLVVPPGGHCGTWVDGCVEPHREGELLAFDDSKVHRAFNNGDGERLVLIVDLERPRDLPVGTAVGGHTEELDAFIRELT